MRQHYKTSKRKEIDKLDYRMKELDLTYRRLCDAINKYLTDRNPDHVPIGISAFRMAVNGDVRIKEPVVLAMSNILDMPASEIKDIINHRYVDGHFVDPNGIRRRISKKEEQIVTRICPLLGKGCIKEKCLCFDSNYCHALKIRLREVSK